MPVNSLHAEYEAFWPVWMRAPDVIAGEDAVKAAGIRYLPRLELQTDEQYAVYKQRAAFYNATARTADGFVGMIFRRPPFVKFPKEESSVGGAMAVLLNDADMLGTSFNELDALYKEKVGGVYSMT